MDNGVLFDRLASGFGLFVENYVLSKNKERFHPSYKVDYEINLEVLEKYTANIDNHWMHLIGGCNDINALPADLKELVIKYLPRFLKQYPQYENEQCLKVIE